MALANFIYNGNLVYCSPCQTTSIKYRWVRIHLSLCRLIRCQVHYELGVKKTKQTKKNNQNNNTMTKDHSWSSETLIWKYPKWNQSIHFYFIL